MIGEQKWDLIFKACSAVAAVVSAVGLVLGGAFGLYTYRQQGLLADAARQKEIRLMEYSQKKDIYSDLVDAAASVAASPTKADAIKNGSRFTTLYYGRAHILVLDPKVNLAKIAFHRALDDALAKGEFPTVALDGVALALAEACREHLNVEDVFGTSTSASGVETRSDRAERMR